MVLAATFAANSSHRSLDDRYGLVALTAAVPNIGRREFLVDLATGEADTDRPGSLNQIQPVELFSVDVVDIGDRVGIAAR